MFDILKKITVMAIILYTAQFINEYEYKANTSTQNHYSSIHETYKEKIKEHDFFEQSNYKLNYYYLNNNNDSLNIEFNKDKIGRISLVKKYSEESFISDIDSSIELIKDIVNVDLMVEKDNIITQIDAFKESNERQQYYTFIDKDYFTFYIDNNNDIQEFTISLTIL